MFPGASSGNPSSATYAIYGAPLDRSTSFQPGTRFGPERIRHFAQGFEDYDHHSDQHFSDLSVVDCGDLHAWNNAEEYLAFLAGELGDIDGIPILLGGEHTVSIAGTRATSPDVFVCLDAHLDLRSAYDGDRWSHATVTHHIREEDIDVILLGSRAGSESEWERVASDDRIVVIEPDAILDDLSLLDFEGKSVYLSIDIDVIDPGFAPGTGTPEPFGIHPSTARSVVSQVAPCIVGADVVEVNDRDTGQAALVAAKLVRRLIFAHAADQA